jgi:hypothetical protein
VELQLHVYLTVALDGDEWSVSSVGHFTPGDTALGIHWTGGWVNRTTDPDADEKVPSCFLYQHGPSLLLN